MATFNDMKAKLESNSVYFRNEQAKNLAKFLIACGVMSVAFVKGTTYLIRFGSNATLSAVNTMVGEIVKEDQKEEAK